MNILLAARDTVSSSYAVRLQLLTYLSLTCQTAALLTFLVYMLALHPEAMKLLRAEIIETLPSGPPTFEHIREFKYCMSSNAALGKAHLIPKS